jgi:hypothetical protein
MKDLSYTDIFNKKHSHKEVLKKNVKDGLVDILMEERKVSEKAFKALDNLSDEVSKFITEDILDKAETHLQSGKRMQYFYELLYDNIYNTKTNEKMNKIIIEKYQKFTISEVKEKIKNLKKLPKEYKEIAVNYVNDLTVAKNGKVSSLDLHEDLKKKIKEKDLPNGFHMGIDKDGYFIHTHRTRSKSFEAPGKISVKAIRFVDSTG